MTRALAVLPITAAAVATLAVGAGSAVAQDKAEAAPNPAPAPSPAAPAAPDPSSFEGLARGAAPAADLGTLLAPMVDKCGGEKREIDRVRCASAQKYLKKKLPGRAFVVSAADPAAISVSDYDGKIKGHKIALAGCLACSQPVAIGASGEKRFVTLREPGKEGESLAQAVELTRKNLRFDSIPEARTWMKNVRPHLRAEFVFQPTDNEWSMGVSKGFAFKLVAGRIYDRCTGDVLYSNPPSTGQAEKIGEEEGCPKAQEQETAKVEKDDDANLPNELGKAEIDKAMGGIKGQIHACFQQFEVPGKADLRFDVAGNGMVQTVDLKGGFVGTPTGDCIREAAKNARFPRFKKARQGFTYPFFLR